MFASVPRSVSRSPWVPVRVLWCLLTSALILLLSGGALAETSLVVRDFEGKKADQVRTWVVSILDKHADFDVIAKKRLEETKISLDGEPEGYKQVSLELGVAAVLEGVVSTKGAKWTLELRVVNGATGEGIEVVEFVGNFPAGLKKTVNKQLLEKLSGPLGKAEVAKPPEPEPAKPEPPATEPEEPEPKQEDKAAEPPPAADTEDHPEALRLGLRGGVLSRSFKYTDDLNQSLRPYELGAAPFARLDLEWYPAASFTSGVAAHFGLVGGYQRAFAVDSETSDGTTLDTQSSAWDAGLRGRIPLGNHELGISVRYGQDRFELDDGDRNFIPSVDYRFVRPALDARLGFGSVFVGLGVGYRVVLSAGEFSERPWFPDQTAGAVDAKLEGGLSLGDLDVLLGAGLVRYFFTLNPNPDDVGAVDDGDAVAGGAVDQYLTGYLGLAYRL